MSTRLLIPILLVFLITTAVELSHAQTKGISFQGVIKDPSNNWVNVTGVTIRARILAPNGCVLRDESYPTQNIVNGYVNLNLGNGTPGGADPGLSFKNVFNNSSSTLTGLTCINTDGTLNGSISSYSPTANDSRKLHISLTVGADNLNAQFNMRSSAFAINSETLNGYADSAFVKTSTNITQSNAEAWFASAAFSQILAGTYNAATATAATSATNVTGTVAIANGGTGATTASGARTNLGLGTLAVMSPSGTADATTYLRGDGTWAAIVAGGGTITAVNAGTGITGGGSSGAVTVSLATAGTAGTYTKVTTDAYGRVTSGTTLSASDIPNLAWSKITSGTPTTLSGYGITDGIQNAGSSATTNITSMQAGTDAAKPAAGTAGRVYLATDTQKIYRDNGTTWDAITSSGGSGTIAGVTAGTGITGGGTSGTVTVGLANIANNSILANTSGSAGAPVATTLSTLLDTVGSTQGSVLYRGAAGWSVLAPGTSGQYLQTQGAGANPQWAAATASNFTGTLPIANGGTGATTANAALNALLPAQSSNAGKVLTTDGTNTSWTTASAGTVTSITAGTGLTGGTINNSGTIGLGTELTGVNSLAATGYVQRTGAGAYSTTSGSTLASNSTLVLRDSSGVSNFYGVGITGATSGTVTFQSPATVTSYSLTLPATQGTAGQILSNNGSGVLSWVSALTNSLTSGNILVGNGSNVATPVSMSGDATMSNTGVVTLKNTGTAGTYTKVTTDAQGRVTSGATLSASDIPNIDWSKITSGTPTTLSGYGITDGIKNNGSSATTNITGMQAGLDASKPAAASAGKLYLATDTQKIYRDNGTTWDVVASATGTGGTITGVTAGTGLTGGGASGSVTVGLANIANNSILANTSGSAGAPVATTLSTLLDTVGSSQGSVLYRGAAGWSVLAPGTSGQYLQTQGAAANPQWSTVSVSSFSGSLAGDVSGTQSATSVDKIKGKTVSPAAYSSGQVLRYDGTNWVNAALSSADLSNDSNLLKASNMPANCSASQALTFSSPTGTWVCSNIAGLDASVITTGTIANARLPASATYWSAATGGINYAGGSVGVGTTTPTANLDIYNSANTSATVAISTPGTGSAQLASLSFVTKADGTTLGAATNKGWTFGAYGNAFSVSSMQNDFGLSYWNGTAWNSPFAVKASTGNVGIGTTSPNRILHISGSPTVDGDLSSQVRVETTGAYNSGNKAGIAFAGIYNSSLTTAGFGGISGFKENTTDGDYASAMTFHTRVNGGGVSERLRITSAGNVGIGTTTPKSVLDVYGSGSGAAVATTGATDATTNARIGRGSVAVNIGMIDSGVGYIQNRQMNDNSVNYNLSLQPNGGNVGIGTTSPSTKLHVNGDVTATSYLYASDRRLKTDIHTLDSSLDKVLNLRGVEFKWKKDNKEEVGFIAQEVEKVDPKLVVEVGAGKSDSFKAVKYGNITAYLVEAIKELYAEITGAKQEVTELRKVVEAQQELIRRNDEINKKLLNRIEKLEKQASAGE